MKKKTGSRREIGNTFFTEGGTHGQYEITRVSVLRFPVTFIPQEKIDKHILYKSKISNNARNCHRNLLYSNRYH